MQKLPVNLLSSLLLLPPAVWTGWGILLFLILAAAAALVPYYFSVYTLAVCIYVYVFIFGLEDRKTIVYLQLQPI